MRLPAYRGSYLGRYHPYPRTRAPAREVVMVRALFPNHPTTEYSTDHPSSPIQSAAESEPSEETSTAAEANTVGDLSGQGSRLLTPR
jgi:hypothetical protein